MLSIFAVLPDWLKKWAIGLALKKVLAWIDDFFSSRAAREVEAREQAQKELDARPPTPDDVDSELDSGRA